MLNPVSKDEWLSLQLIEEEFMDEPGSLIDHLIAIRLIDCFLSLWKKSSANVAKGRINWLLVIFIHLKDSKELSIKAKDWWCLPSSTFEL